MSKGVKDLKWINNGKINKRVPLDQLDTYLNDGWIIGNLPTTTGHIWINKDGKNTMIDESKLDEYIANGWTRGKISSFKERNRVKVYKDNITKSIQKEELEIYLANGWTRGVAFHNRWITNDIEEKWTDIELPDGWKEGRLYKNPNEIISVYNDTEVLEIKKVELHEYKKRGYKEGKGKLVGLYEGSTKNTIWMNNGINTVCVKPNEVDNYLNNGYVKGNLNVKNRIAVNNGNSTKKIKLQDLDSYLNNGYEIGISYQNSMLNRKWVQKGNLFRTISIEEYDKYISDGWLPGRPIKASLNKVWVHKDNQLTYINLDELNDYLKNGWNSGKTDDFKFYINNGKEDKLVDWNEYNLVYRNDKSWKIGTKNHGCSSIIEEEFKKLLNKNNIKYDVQHFYLNYNGKRYFYDFKIGNILIELNPYATHNSTWNPYNLPVEQDYHYNKTKAATDNGYRCINIWDWDNIDILLKLLIRKEKIYARQCNIQEVDISMAKDFLNTYHFQGYAKDSIRIGLFYNNKLVSIMTFNKPRYNSKFKYELIRYCSSVNIIGGIEKLFKYFTSNYTGSIISYCDLSKFNGNVYNKLGFKLTNISIGKHWYNPILNKHITDNLLRQYGFDKLLGKEFGYYGKGTSNEQLMLDHGFYIIYDSGQAKYEYNN